MIINLIIKFFFTQIKRRSVASKDLCVSATALNQNIDVKGSTHELLSPTQLPFKSSRGSGGGGKEIADSAEVVEMATRGGDSDGGKLAAGTEQQSRKRSGGKSEEV